VGEPLNAEAVIWGEENFDSIMDNWWQNGGIMIANYPSMKVKPMGKPLPVEIAIAEVNGKQLKIITEPNVQGQLVLKKAFLPYFVLICMRRNGIKNVLLANGTSAVIWQRCRRLFWFIGRADDIIKPQDTGPFEVEYFNEASGGGGSSGKA
jgi:acetyl-CoA synthetase